MRLHSISRAQVAFGLALLASLSRPAAAQFGQLHPSFYGSTEIDTRHSAFYLAGLYIGVGGFGWSPYLNVNGYGLNYRPVAGLTTTSTLSAIAPTLGLAYAQRNQGVSFGAGYNWVHNENPGAPGAEGGGSTGVTASFGAYRIGNPRRGLRTQLLSNYNFDSRYVWARARASVPFSRSQQHPSRMGAEIVGQGGGRDGSKSNSFQAGPTFEYTWTSNLRSTLAGGWKTIGGPAFPDRENAGYIKLDFSVSP